MNRFQKIERDASMSMEHRRALLAKPCEFFRPMFDGRIPSLEEKMLFVEQAVQRMASMHIYENDIYHVELAFTPPYIELDIRRRDGQRCKDWRHFQQIKNELIGPEYEAVELFPAESRLVDTANQYHLWVYERSGFRFPFGFDRRFVPSESVTFSQLEIRRDVAALPADRVA